MASAPSGWFASRLSPTKYDRRDDAGHGYEVLVPPLNSIAQPSVQEHAAPRTSRPKRPKITRPCSLDGDRVAPEGKGGGDQGSIPEQDRIFHAVRLRGVYTQITTSTPGSARTDPLLHHGLSRARFLRIVRGVEGPVAGDAGSCLKLCSSEPSGQNRCGCLETIGGTGGSHKVSY